MITITSPTGKEYNAFTYNDFSVEQRNFIDYVVNFLKTESETKKCTVPSKSNKNEIMKCWLVENTLFTLKKLGDKVFDRIAVMLDEDEYNQLVIKETHAYEAELGILEPSW